MRTMISFYVDSAVADRRIMKTTAPQIEKKLERIFDSLENEYNVSVKDDTIEGLNAPTLQRWFNANAQGWKPATANNYICIINPFLRWAFTMEYLQRDLSSILHTAKLPNPDDLPEGEKPKSKYYTQDQIDDLLTEKTGRNLVRDRAIIALILTSGFRVSEVCDLTIGQVMDVPHGFVRLRRKGGAWKDAPIKAEIYPMLEAYLATRSDTANRSAPLFVTTHGKPCSQNQIYRALRYKQEALGLAVGPHALRHTAITRMEHTYGAAIARDFANHRSITVTNRYTHTTAEELQAAVNGRPIL